MDFKYMFNILHWKLVFFRKLWFIASKEQCF